jgi:negative regulator of flagellin synthesis FlgM
MDTFFHKRLLFLVKAANNIGGLKIEGETIMKINGTDLRSRLSVYKTEQAQGTKLEAVKTGKTGVSAAQQDRVALSEQGRLIADAQRAVAFIPDVRASLVSEVKNEVDNGTYVFDHQRSAEGILRESMVNQAALYY